MILLQAETEVTAAPKAAGPLASVSVQLMLQLPAFARIFWAKLVQRSGGWCIPCTEPSGATIKGRQRRKGGGPKDGEPLAEYCGRIAGILRLYFEIMKISIDLSAQLENEWKFPRANSWLLHLIRQPMMTASPIAACCVHCELSNGRE
jgi:nucleoporin GLE1